MEIKIFFEPWYHYIIILWLDYLSLGFIKIFRSNNLVIHNSIIIKSKNVAKILVFIYKRTKNIGFNWNFYKIYLNKLGE